MYIHWLFKSYLTLYLIKNPDTLKHNTFAIYRYSIWRHIFYNKIIFTYCFWTGSMAIKVCFALIVLYDLIYELCICVLGWRVCYSDKIDKVGVFFVYNVTEQIFWNENARIETIQECNFVCVLNFLCNDSWQKFPQYAFSG